MSPLSLIDRYFDGQIEASEQQELGQLIASDPAVAVAFVDCSRTHAALEQHFENTAARLQVRLDIASIVEAQAPSDATATCGLKRPSPLIRWRRPAIAAAAAVMALAAAAQLARHGSEPEDTASSATPIAAAHQPRSTAAPDPYLGSPEPPVVAGRDVKRELRSFYLPGLAIAPMPIEDALAMVAGSVGDIAHRHAAHRMATIDFSLGDQLAANDPRREHLVSLTCNSVCIADALQLLAGQAGMNVAFLDGAAELRPRRDGEPPLRSRKFDVLDDFFESASEMVSRDGSAANPLAMLAHSPPSDAISYLQSLGDGSSKLFVRATSDDLASITALISMLQENGNNQITMTSKLIDLSPEAVDHLHQLSSTTDKWHLGGLLSAISNPEPADQIIADPEHLRQLLTTFHESNGINILTLPTAVARPDVKVVVSQPDHEPSQYVHLAADGEITNVISAYLDPEVTEFEGYINYNSPKQTYITTKFVEVMQENVGEVLPATTPDGQRAGIEVIRSYHWDGEQALPVGPDADDGSGSEIAIDLGDGQSSFSPSGLDDSQTDHPKWAVNIGSQAYLNQRKPSYSSAMVASLEGEAVRLSGILSLSSQRKDQALFDLTSAMLTPSEPDGGDDDEMITAGGFSFDLDQDGSLDFIPFTPTLPPPSVDEIDFDATVAAGQTLLLEIERENGGKQLVLLTAEKR